MDVDDSLAADRPWRKRIDDSGLMRRPGTALRFNITCDERWRARYCVDDAKPEELLDHRQLPPSFRCARGFHLCPFGDPVAARLTGAGWLPASRYAVAVASIAVECPGPLGLLGVDRSVAIAWMAAQTAGVGG